MWRAAALAAVAAAVALAIPAVQHLRETRPAPPAARLSLAAPPGTDFGADDVLDAAISPDQREIVFVATQRRRTAPEEPPDGVSRLWRRPLDAEKAAPIPGTEGARLPAWKQTGKVLSFFAEGRLKLLNLTNGAVTAVADAPEPRGAAWLRDGSLLFVPASGPVRRLSPDGVRDATTLATGDVAHVFPGTALNGDDFLYVAVRDDGRRVVRLHSDMGDTDLRTTAAHAALPVPGWLLIMQGDTLVAESRQEDGARARRSVPVALDVGTTPRGRGLFVASADLLLHARPSERLYRLTWLDLQGSQVGTTADVGDYRQVRVSPDGRHLAVTANDALLGSLDVLKIAIDEASPSLRLTESIAADTDPVWSPDNRRLLFRSLSGGTPAVFITSSDIVPLADVANGDARTSTLAPEAEGATDWRGEDLLLQRRSKAGFDLVRVRLASGTEIRDAVPVANSAFNETDGRWSPDGRWIAYVSDEPGRPDIYVVGRSPGPAGGPGSDRQRVSFGGGTHPRWTRDSRTLLFLRGSTLMRADVAGGTRLGSPRPVVDVRGIRDFDVSRQSDRLVAIVPVQSEAVDTVSVILNWRSAAEALLRQSQPKTAPKF